MSLSDIDENVDDTGEIDENDNIPNLDNTSQMKSLLDSVLSNTPTIEDSVSNTVRSAFQTSSWSSTRFSLSFSDTIRSYVEPSVLFNSRKDKSSYYLSIEHALNPSDLNPLASDKLCVGNINYKTTEGELKQFFSNFGFTVVNIDFIKKTGPYNNGGTAFVRFNSIETAEVVLNNFNAYPKRFQFQKRNLKISRLRLRQRQPNINTFNLYSTDGTFNTVDFNISNVLYGTLMNSDTINNIAGGHFADELGLIAHRLVENESQMRMHLRIDSFGKKIAISVTNSHYVYKTSTEIIFEWAFDTLRANKISPVLINHSYFALLIQIKQPPVILQKVSDQSAESGHEKRMPGTPLIGHANAWLVYLSGNSVHRDYLHLFKILSYFNLTPKRFAYQNILRLMSNSMKQDTRYFRHVRILSNDKWITENRSLVDHFLNNRWPKYPFETKFEIMKLLSKHIITIQDLIIDEHFDLILAKCSLNILVICTEKIITYASRWLHETCDNEYNDPTEEEEEQPAINDQTEENSLMDDDTTSIMVQSAMGTLIDATNAEFVLSTDNIRRLNVQAGKEFPGNLSWFLMRAIRELQEKHELKRTTIDGIFVSKHELYSVHRNTMTIRKIYITPSTILYEGPYLEEKCLVTRHFTEVQDGFLRVGFRDENYKKLQSTGSDMSKLYDRVKAILDNGMSICDRYYDFLAFSSSQIREHSCWLYSTMKDISANDIRSWMGDFSNIHPVAKMAARLGQSFSTTKKGVELQNHQTKEIDDEKPNQLCLTDGIGIIAPWLARQLSKELGFVDTNEYPCAFQIRFSGYKGMVCLDVDNRIMEPHVGLYLRPSMNKFESKNLAIDIVRFSAISAGYLSRQIILLLSSLGINDEVFHSLQDQMLDNLKTLPRDHENARKFLRKFGLDAGNGYHRFLIEYLKRFRNKIEPFAQKLLIAFQGFLLKELRVRAHIFVSNTWTLLGVIDETKTLKYGQVFVQIEEKNESGKIISKILTGPIIITRTPCFHPGDVRRLEAIDIPALHQLKNVVVFPIDKTGSHPMEMSGGDLDGDSFWVSNEEKLLFNENEQPFDYHDQANEDAKQIQLNSDKEYSINDISKFFVEYIESDNLGLIAHSHMAFADQSYSRAKGDQCLKLARMHSTAVDFAKSGVRAERITSDLRPTTYPHFMENHSRNNYTSTTILGQLYDSVVKFEKDLNRQEQYEVNSFPYEKLIINGSDQYMTEAESTKYEYDLELYRIMRQYGIRNEAELVSGYIIKFTSKQYAKENKIFDLRMDISHSVKILQDKYLRIFYKDIYENLTNQQDSVDEIKPWSEVSKELSWKKQIGWFEFYTKLELSNESEIAKKASAWFRVTYQCLNNQLKLNGKNKSELIRKKKDIEQNRPRSPDLFSFPWIVYPILMKIFDEKQLDF